MATQEQPVKKVEKAEKEEKEEKAEKTKQAEKTDERNIVQTFVDGDTETFTQRVHDKVVSLTRGLTDVADTDE